MNGENGQALPLAMMALAIGTLVITPFLSHASSGLIGSRTYGEAIVYYSSCDAGVEHAIWNVTRGELAEKLVNPGDEETYQLGEALNGLTISITVTLVATEGGGGGSAGEITDRVIDTYDFGTNGGDTPDIVHVSGDIYAVTFADWYGSGWVATIEVNDDGMITARLLDALEFDNHRCQWSNIIHVSGDIYAIAYRGQGNDGFVTTVSIAADGNIGRRTIDSLEFDKSNCVYPVIINVSGSTFAIAYEGSGGDGFIKTITIYTDGEIANGTIDTLEFDTRDGHEPDMIHVDGNIFAVAYKGRGSDGSIITVDIAPDGEINNRVVDTFEFNTNSCYYPAIAHVYGNVFAISYTGASPMNGDWWGGILTTVEIRPDGNIANSIIDEIVFDSSSGDYSDIILVGGGVFGIVYTGQSSDGWLTTVMIDNDGAITEEILDTLEFDTRTGFYPAIIHINGDIFAVVYTGGYGWYGVIKTIGISTGESATASYEIVAATGDKSITASVNTENETAAIISWLID